MRPHVPHDYMRWILWLDIFGETINYFYFVHDPPFFLNIKQTVLVLFARINNHLWNARFHCSNRVSEKYNWYYFEICKSSDLNKTSPAYEFNKGCELR